MSMVRISTVGMIVVATAVAGWLAWPAPPPKPRPKTPRVERSEADPHSAASKHDPRLERLERRIAELELAADDRATPAEPDEALSQEQRLANAEQDLEAEMAKAREQQAAQEQAYLDRLQVEGPSYSHTGEVSQRIDELMAEAALAGSQVDDVRCSSSLCQVNVSYKSQNGREPFLQAMMRGLRGYNGWYRHEDTDNGPVSRVYIEVQSVETTGTPPG